MTLRQKDINGYLLIKDNPISKVGVFPYLGKEIGAPEPERVYSVYRPESELSDPEALASFNLLPFIDDHEFLGDGGTPAEKKGVQGSTGESAAFDFPYLKNSIRVYSDFLKGQIDGGKTELSPSYRCEYDFTPGSFDGVQYDAIQRNIRGNHLALVQKGRTGPDVKVLDTYPVTCDTAEYVHMNENQPFTEAQLEALKALIAEAMAAAAVVEDATAPPKDPAGDPDAEAASAAAKEAAALAAKEAEDKAAQAASTADSIAKMQAAIITKLNDRDALAKRLVPHVGVFDSAQMLSAEDVAIYGCKKLGITASDSHRAVLEGFLQGAKVSAPAAQDAKPVTGTSTATVFWEK